MRFVHLSMSHTSRKKKCQTGASVLWSSFLLYSGLVCLRWTKWTISFQRPSHSSTVCLRGESWQAGRIGITHLSSKNHSKMQRWAESSAMLWKWHYHFYQHKNALCFKDILFVSFLSHKTLTFNWLLVFSLLISYIFSTKENIFNPVQHRWEHFIVV